MKKYFNLGLDRVTKTGYSETKILTTKLFTVNLDGQKLTRPMSLKDIRDTLGSIPKLEAAGYLILEVK